MASTLDDLQCFSIPNALRFEPGSNGLPKATITTPAAQAEIYLHGAHVTRFHPAGQHPVLWMSAKSLFQPDKPIRGGVPLIFPWFGPRAGDPASPAHGFARVKEWDVEATRQHDNGDIELLLTLRPDAQTRATWPHEFTLHYVVRVGRTLDLALRVRNDGPAPFDFEEALHTYLTVTDVRQSRVTGLEGATYVDKTDAMKRKPQGPDPITITAETDRVYEHTTSTCVLHDPVLHRHIEVAKSGSRATVVWNPWVAKSKAMPDFGDDEWPTMICIETCNVGEDRAMVKPGETHEMRAVIGPSAG